MSITFSDIIFDVQSSLIRFDKTLQTYGFNETEAVFSIEDLLKQIKLNSDSDEKGFGFCYLGANERRLYQKKKILKHFKNRKLPKNSTTTKPASKSNITKKAT